MAASNIIANSVYPVLSQLAVYYSLSNPDPIVYPKTSVWRPPQWKNSAQTLITIPATSVVPARQTPGLLSQFDLPSAPSYPATIYVFDSVFKVAHSNEIKLTEYPVQNGAPISDHAMILPNHVTLEIGMSDAMDSYQQPSPWTANKSKSVSAFQAMMALLQQRVLVTITTRLQTYYNMMLISQTSDDSHATQFGLRAILNFRQVFLATVTTSNATSPSTSSTASSLNTSPETNPYVYAATGSGNQSELPDFTDYTPSGATSTANVPANVTVNNQLSTAAIKQLGLPTTVPGQLTPSGTSWNSTNTFGLKLTF